MVYFLPDGRPYRADVVDSMKAGIRSIQAFYGEQMERHGYGYRTFRFEVDESGDPLVHRVDDLDGSGESEIRETFDLSAGIYLIVIDDGRGVRGVASRTGKTSGDGYVQGGWDWEVAAHELGHTFGLLHDFRDGAYIMSYGPGPRNELSACAAEFLAVHPYFNDDVPTEEGAAPRIEITSPLGYPAGSTSWPVRLKVTDSEGVHQAILFSGDVYSALLRACRGLGGEREAMAEFEYDGNLPFASLDDPVHPVQFYAVDTHGNVGEASVTLAQVSPQDIATLEGHTDRVESVAFSPDGTLLATGSRDETIKLWDVPKREEMQTLSGHGGGVASVAFSSGDKTLASAGEDGVRVWDLEAGVSRVILQRPATTVVFAPDQPVVAAGSWDGSITLWETRVQAVAAELKGQGVRAMSFSPSGDTLASVGRDGTVEFWDWRSGERRAMWSLDWSWQYAFSHDLGSLAGGGGTIRLWDLVSGTASTPLEGLASNVSTVGFSPEGSILVGGTLGGGIWVWDLVAEEPVGVLSGQRSGVSAVAFSADGTMLASGGEGGDVKLWAARLGARHPQTLTKVSGDEQEGPAGAWAAPFTVLVQDQYGEPLAGEVVTFRVVTGGGTLSIETSKTDAEGRAGTTLTLGRQPGRNTVKATVAELEQVTFVAIGIAVPEALTKLSGDEQQASTGEQIPEPLVVSVRDQNGEAFAGAVITFELGGSGGMLSVLTDTTDTEGLAATRLTLGEELGTYTVVARAVELEPVTFTATAEATPDFNGDGVTDLADFFLFSEAFGGSDPRFDLDGSGTVDFADFFLFAEHFGQPARAKLLALARERIGLPEGPQLQPNAPNPFNSGTVISWFQLQPGPARLEVFALTGQRVAVLHEGAEKIGYHRLHWDGRSDQGHPLASGVYVYRLVIAEGAWTRKLTLLR